MIVEAKDTDVIDEFVPAQQALLMRQQAGLIDARSAPGPTGMGISMGQIGMGQEAAPVVSAPAPAAPARPKNGSFLRRCGIVAGVSILAGVAVGYGLGCRAKTA